MIVEDILNELYTERDLFLTISFLIVSFLCIILIVLKKDSSSTKEKITFSIKWGLFTLMVFLFFFNQIYKPIKYTDILANKTIQHSLSKEQYQQFLEDLKTHLEKNSDGKISKPQLKVIISPYFSTHEMSEKESELKQLNEIIQKYKEENK